MCRDDEGHQDAQRQRDNGHECRTQVEQEDEADKRDDQELLQQLGSQVLHGALGEVRCLGCGDLTGRDEVQALLEALNPGCAEAPVEEAPDGDAELALTEGFRVPACPACGGVLKPHVVFFGDNVPAARLAQAFGLFDEGEVLLVAGSSLTVFSGYRFVRRAAERGVPVLILNQGPTRGDALAALCWSAPLGEALPALAQGLTGALG